MNTAKKQHVNSYQHNLGVLMSEFNRQIAPELSHSEYRIGLLLISFFNFKLGCVVIDVQNLINYSGLAKSTIYKILQKFKTIEFFQSLLGEPKKSLQKTTHDMNRYRTKQIEKKYHHAVTNDEYMINQDKVLPNPCKVYTKRNEVLGKKTIDYNLYNYGILVFPYYSPAFFCY